MSPARLRTLEETTGRAFINVFVETCNQLAEWDGGRAALSFTAIDVLDSATRNTLIQLISRPQWLRLPLIMLARDGETGALAELADSVRSHFGADAVLHIPVDKPEQSRAFNWSTLTPEDAAGSARRRSHRRKIRSGPGSAVAGRCRPFRSCCSCSWPRMPEHR